MKYIEGVCTFDFIVELTIIKQKCFSEVQDLLEYI